jgi:hypothetical protein
MVIGVFLDNVPDGRVSAKFREAVASLLPGSPTKALEDMLSDMRRKTLFASVRATTTATPLWSPPDEPYRETPPRVLRCCRRSANLRASATEVAGRTRTRDLGYVATAATLGVRTARALGQLAWARLNQAVTRTGGTPS